MNLKPGASGPECLEAIGPRVDRRLDRLLGTEIERWAAVDLELRHPLETLRRAVAGGKRLRPAFCYWSFVGAGGDPDAAAVIDAGAALEMLHGATLIHDDVIDGSLRRRGEDTVHVQYADRHRTSAWGGDTDRFGAGVAILLGDLALAYSNRLLVGAPPAAVAVFDEVRIEVNIGQYLDVLGAAEGLRGTEGPAPPAGDGAGAGAGGPAWPAGDEAASATVARARRICRYKTAKYTVERPLHLGAALAAADRLAELNGPLSAFGLPLGEAFQLRDDLLGVFGDPSVTGKPVGDDLREGKPTLLASLAYARATGNAARVLEAHLGDPGLSESDVLELREIIEATGARQEVEATIDRLAATAEGALAALPLLPVAQEALGALAAFATGRDH